MTTFGSLSLVVALSGFLAIVYYLVRSRHEGWGGWAASMPLHDEPPLSSSTLAPNGTKESA